MRKKPIQSMVVILTCLVLSGPANAANFLVENLNDSGTGSLRQAIASANASAEPNTIEFNGGLNGTINLSSALPALAGELLISGPGAAVITVNGNSLYQPFFVPGGSTVSITGLTIENGLAQFGGGIGNEGDLTVTDCVLANNNAEFSGGAIDNFDGSVIVSQSRLSGNTTDENGVGAGVANTENGTISIVESTLTGNTAGFGGALDNLGTITIVRSTLSSNNATEYGGAIENAGTLTIRNSTISGNVAGVGGGGIDNFEGATSIEFSTLAENSAGSSGGGIENTASVTFKNSLVVKSVAGGNCVHDAGGTFTALGVNFATDASCPGFTQTTSGGINLGPLADNGGTTLTHALLAGSAATNAALDCTLSDGTTPVTQDQRGQARPQGSECDSGSFEGSESSSDLIFADGFES